MSVRRRDKGVCFELADSCVIMGIRIWVKTEDYWDAKWRMNENIKYALDENEIEIPYPQMDVTIRQLEDRR